MSVTDIGDKICLWQDLDVGDSYDHFSPTSSNTEYQAEIISLRNQLQNAGIKI